MSTAPVTRVQNGMVQGRWRPPQWAQKPAILITVPATTSTDAGTPFSTIMYPSVAYVFDAVLDAEHEQTLTKTVHPVQTNAAVNSHAFLNPATVVMYVLMSDVSPNYSSGLSTQSTQPFIEPWTGKASKSVSAYQQMLKLQAQRVLLTVTTRLRTYSNMLVTKVSPREDSKTINGARFSVEFEQIFLVDTQAAPASSRPNDTASTGLGAVNPSAPSVTAKKQFQVVPPLKPLKPLPGLAPLSPLAPLKPLPALSPLAPLSSISQVVDVPGAGTYASQPQQLGLGQQNV